jgi:hypothetical protein
VPRDPRLLIDLIGHSNVPSLRRGVNAADLPHLVVRALEENVVIIREEV